MTRWQTRAVLGLIALAFIAAGLLFIPRMGIEVDEAIVANGIYPHGDPWYSIRLGPNGIDEIPIMLISYLGALKTWMYSVIFYFTPPRPISLRLPTLLLAAASLWLFFALLRRTTSDKTAWIATLLLATDSTYLLMNAIDYGPVTLHFVFKLAAMLLLVRFHQQSGQARSLEAAFFLLGLALWDKAIFGWVLMGTGGAALIVFWSEISRHLSPRTILRATLAGAAGALPLILYNIVRPLETLRANASVEQLAILGKSVILTRAMDGSVLFGFMTAGDAPPSPPAPEHWFQSLSIGIAELLGRPQSNFTLWAVAATILAIPLLWRTPARRPVIFGLLASLGTWIPMVLTAGAGAAAQHVVMLWPFPLLALGAALAQIPKRLAIVATLLLCSASLAVTNEYYAELIQLGPSLRWTDAMDPLHHQLSDMPPADPDHFPGRTQIWIADWGIMETMNLLGQGQLDIYIADRTSDDGRRAMFDNPNSVFVAHPREIAFHPEERADLDEFAARQHYTEEPITTIYDRYGRPTFDIFRFRKSGP